MNSKRRENDLIVEGYIDSINKRYHLISTAGSGSGHPSGEVAYKGLYTSRELNSLDTDVESQVGNPLHYSVGSGMKQKLPNGIRVYGEEYLYIMIPETINIDPDQLVTTINQLIDNNDNDEAPLLDMLAKL